MLWRTLFQFFVRRSEEDFSAVIAQAPYGMLVLITKLLSPRYHQPQRYPYWRFGIAETIKDKNTLRRLAIWQIWPKRFPGRTLTIKWYHGLRLVVYFGNDLSRCTYVGGAYEPNEMAFVHHYLKPGMHFIDIGANEGIYSLLAAARVGKNGKVWALEPSTREFLHLKENLQANGLLSEVQCFHLALSDSPGQATLKLAEMEHAGQNTLGEFIYNIQSTGTEDVTLTTLDYLTRKEPHLCADLIKIDVEGSEWKVLQGAVETLRLGRPVVLFEQRIVDGKLPEEMVQFWREQNYAVSHFDDDGRAVEGLPSIAGVWNLIAVPVEKSAVIREYNLA